MSAIRSGITQAAVSTEGIISAEGNIGKNKAQGSIDSEGIWDLGIDFKLGGLGITNDYGGAITVSIAGQSITWGREGGKIHYDLGGFEMIVEARDCVVTETKKIMGIEVASHTYPDPGCELPLEPSLPAPPVPPFDPEKGIELEDGPEKVYLVLQGSFSLFERTFNSTEINTFTTRITVSNIAENIVLTPDSFPQKSTLLPFTVSENYKAERVQIALPNKLIRDTNLKYRTLTSEFSGKTDSAQHISIRSGGAYYETAIPRYNGTITATGDDQLIPAWSSNWVPPVKILYGTKTNCKNYIKTLAFSYVAPDGSYSRYQNYVIKQVIPVGKQKLSAPQPFLQPGVPPHMNNCCEEVLDILEDLKDVLHVDFFKKEEFPIPTYLLAPGCEPGKTTKAQNYYHLFQKIFQAIAHSTIISPQIDIQDADAVKEGDQKINERYLSATGWAEAVTKMLYEIVDDGNIGTNMDIRTGVTVTQLLVAVADLSHKVDCIIDCIGVTTKRGKGEVVTSYNLVVEGENNKGFDPKKSNQQLDLNQDISTEKLLNSLLRTRKNPIVKEEIHPKSPTLFELINDLKNK